MFHRRAATDSKEKAIAGVLAIGGANQEQISQFQPLSQFALMAIGRGRGRRGGVGSQSNRPVPRPSHSAPHMSYIARDRRRCYQRALQNEP